MSVPLQEISKVKKLYESGLSVRGVSDRLGLTVKQVRIRLDKVGMVRRSPGFYQRKYFFNEDFFEIIDTEQKAYWLGFIAADGLVTDSKRKRLIIRLGRKDRKHLVRFLSDLEATNPVKDRVNNFGHPFSYISLCSRKIFNDLVDKGIMPRKTFKLEAPTKVPDDLIYHWIRGYFDGDGTVFTPTRSPKSLIVVIYGMAPVLFFIKDTCGIDRPVESKDNHFMYRLGKRAHVMEFYAYLSRAIPVRSRKLRPNQPNP